MSTTTTATSPGAGIPLIDLEKLNGNGSESERREVVEAIARACESHGFFMVTNHGISAAVVERMQHMAQEFFRLSESQRERVECYNDDESKNWRDSLRLQCYPLESFVNKWPSNPPSFRQAVGTYATEARALALRLLEAISESLGLKRTHMDTVAAMERHEQHTWR